MNNLSKFFVVKYKDTFLFFLTSLISLSSLVYFYLHDNLNLMNYDAFARLNIARKIIDNISPGVGQLGSIWPPLPQLFFLPVIGNDFLWHSGLAGSFISTVAFVFGSLYLEKTAFLLTKSLQASFVAWFIFVTNQNILLFQTSPMSESFFLFSIIMVLYFLTRWSKSQSALHLAAAAVFVAISTLTRYEGYFVLTGSFISIFVLLLINYGRKNIALIEGTLILFLTIATYGIFLWCAYSLLFFKDPIAWLHFYSHTEVEQKEVLLEVAAKNTFLDSFLTYSQVSIWMSGLVNFILGVAGYLFIILVVVKKAFKKGSVNLHLSILIISTVLFSLLIFGYQKGFIPLIVFHKVTLLNLLDKSLNFYSHWGSPNIRYGIIMVPFLAIFAGFLVSKSRVRFFLLIMLVTFQILTNFYTPLYLQFSIPKVSKYIELKPAVWLRTNYDGGLILVGSSRHEDLMFQTNFEYKKFIHEGTKKYWLDSLEDPSKHANWVVYNELLTDDKLPSLLSANAYNIIEQKFSLVYSDVNGYKIFKRI